MPIKLTGNSEPNILTRIKSMGDGRGVFRGLGGDDILVALHGDINRLYGGEGNDTLIGNSVGKNQLIGEEGNDLAIGGDKEDTLIGGTGNDRVFAGGGNDKIWDVIARENNNDLFMGGSGDDTIVSRGGADRLYGEDGNDVLRSISDAGEPVPAQDASALVNDGEPVLDPSLVNDTLVGGAGSDRFTINSRISAKREILAKHADENGENIDYKGVAGENGAAHDHWLESFGQDTILDFNKAEGDKIILRGHTNQVESITNGIDEDGQIFSQINVISDQGNDGQGGGGSHDLDKIGTLIVYGSMLTEDDIGGAIKVNAGVFDGQWKSLAEFDEFYGIEAAD